MPSNWIFFHFSSLVHPTHSDSFSSLILLCAFLSTFHPFHTHRIRIWICLFFGRLFSPLELSVYFSQMEMMHLRLNNKSTSFSRFFLSPSFSISNLDHLLWINEACVCVCKFFSFSVLVVWFAFYMIWLMIFNWYDLTYHVWNRGTHSDLA